MDKLAQLYPAHLRTLIQTHDRALAETGFDHALIFGGSLKMMFLDDMPYPFKVNPHFKWWVPVLDNPNCLLVYTPGMKPLLIFYKPVDFWHKVAESPAGYWVDHFDIRFIAEPNEAQQYLPSDRKRAAFLGEWDPSFHQWGLSQVNAQPLLEHLHYARAWKTDYEIESMRVANRVGARGHVAAEKAFRAGATEYEIHLEYLRATDHVEAQLPYGNIIALNEHAAVLHWQHLSQTPPQQLNSFLIDAGASYNGYASDITRTHSRNGDEFQSMIDAMDRLQQELCAEVKPRLDYKELQMTTHRKIGTLLADFGLVTDANGAFEEGVTRAFFPHGVGHYIGLQVHDVGGFSADATGKTIPKPEGQPFLRLTRIVEERQVFTIEPGIYFIDSLLGELREKPASKLVTWSKVDAFRKYGGIRIEDDVVVTSSGHENMTRDAFGDNR